MSFMKRKFDDFTFSSWFTAQARTFSTKINGISAKYFFFLLSMVLGLILFVCFLDTFSV